MRLLKRLSIVSIVIVFFVASFGLTFLGTTKQAAAALTNCTTGPIIFFGRTYACGYYHNRLSNFASSDPIRFVLPEGIPANVNTVQEFIDMVICNLDGGRYTTSCIAGAGNAQHVTASQFYIHSMLGSWPLPYQTKTKSVSQFERGTWRLMMALYSNDSEDGSTSTGLLGKITWKETQTATPCGTPDSYYQADRDDIAPYLDRNPPPGYGGGPSGNYTGPYSPWDPNQPIYEEASCGPGTSWQSMTVYDRDDKVTYMIDRKCGNTRMATAEDLPPPPAIPPPDFNLVPSINTNITGPNGSSSTGNTAQPDDTINVTYTINNQGTTPSSGTTWDTYTYTYPGSHNPSSSPPPGCPAGTSGCIHNSGSPGSIAPGSPFTTSGLPIPITPTHEGSTICTTFFVHPATPGAAAPEGTAEQCIAIANRPYLKVYGGDIAAGSGLDCASNPRAGIATWNRGSSHAYAGAGTQYATYAMDAINGFASAQSSPGAPAPTGLSFANTVNVDPPAGKFGGGFETAPCIANYYDRINSLPLPPASFPTPTPPGQFTALDGNYAFNSNTILERPGGGGGDLTVGSGNRITIYIDGNLFISNNVVYPTTMDITSIPLFQVVVRGNIYISRNVSQLDGIYIAQKHPNAGGINTADDTGGVIYTCATAPFTPADHHSNSFYTDCNNKLTINGAFIANSIEFLRTAGKLSLSQNDGPSGNNAAEVFNFNPSLWLTQPTTTPTATVDSYDAITSLPPIL